eukprot:gene33274-43026_t
MDNSNGKGPAENSKTASTRIQWDEVTIAEHDKERGSRQKIDEAPTPYRYMSSESDQSECESGSDAESLGSLGHNSEKIIKELASAGVDNSDGNGVASIPTSGATYTPAGICHTQNNLIENSWEAINAKLQYEKHLQDSGLPSTSRPPSLHRKPSHRSNSRTGSAVSFNEVNVAHVLHVNEFGELPDETHANAPSVENKDSMQSVFVRANEQDTAEQRHQFRDIDDLSDMHYRGDKEEDGREQDLNRRQFKSKRAGHYNEFKVLKAMRQSHRSEEEEDDEDDDNHIGPSSNSNNTNNFNNTQW